MYQKQFIQKIFMEPMVGNQAGKKVESGKVGEVSDLKVVDEIKENETPELIRDRPQHGIKRREIPHWGNVLRGFQSVGLLKVGELEEKATHFRGKEQNCAEEKQENRNALNIVHRVIRVEPNAIQRYAVGILLFLNFHSVRVIRSNLVQRKNVQNYQRKQHYGQSYHVQRKESV